MEFSKKLAKLCARLNLLQADIVRALGDVSRTKVSNWFAGKNKPDIDEGLRLAGLLRVDLGYLADDSLDEPEERDRPATDDPRWDVIVDMVNLIGHEEARRRLILSGLEYGKLLERAIERTLGRHREVGRQAPEFATTPPYQTILKSLEEAESAIKSFNDQAKLLDDAGISPPKGPYVGSAVIDLNPRGGVEERRPADEPPPTVPARPPLKAGDTLLEIEGKPKRRKKSG